MAKDPKTGKELPKGISWKADKQLYMARFTHQGQSYTFYDKDLKAIKKTLSEKRYEVEHGLQGKADKISLNKWYQRNLCTYLQTDVFMLHRANIRRQTSITGEASAYPESL